MSPNYNGTVLNFSSSDTPSRKPDIYTKYWLGFPQFRNSGIYPKPGRQRNTPGTKSPLDSLTTGINDEMLFLPTETRLMNNLPESIQIPSTKIAFTLKTPALFVLISTTCSARKYALWLIRDSMPASISLSGMAAMILVHHRHQALISLK
jgi:hypothetical protein